MMASHGWTSCFTLLIVTLLSVTAVSVSSNHIGPPRRSGQNIAADVYSDHVNNDNNTLDNPHTVASSRPPLPPRPPWPWSWDVVATWAMPGFTVRTPPQHGTNTSGGQMTADEARAYSQFSIFSTQAWDVECIGGNASCKGTNACACLGSDGTPRGYWQDDEESRMAIAVEATREHNPKQPYVPYAYFTVSQSQYAGQAGFNDAANAAMWLRDGEGRPLNGTRALGGGPHMPSQGLGMESHLYDFAQATVRDYYITTVVAPFVNAPWCNGIVFDEVTWLLHNYSNTTIGASTLGGAARQLAYRDGLLTMIGELSDHMLSHSKFPFYSTQTHLYYYPEIYEAFTDVLASHGGGRLWEFYCLNDHAHPIGGANSTCLNDVLTLQHEASRGIPAVVHVVWGPSSEPPFDTLTFGLAAFLVAAGEYQYFVWGPSNEWRLRNPSGGTDFVFYDEYRRRLGAPNGIAQRNGTQFARQFAHASVWVDVATRNATITWL